ncbi:MAG: B3/4 domain-containing protein [Clostridia bacterium]|nr:B3/4 domain-containing protein [Clostridia bacterium]
MKRFVMEPAFLDLFPESRIGVVVCTGIDNHVKDEERFAPWLRECEKLSAVYTANPEFTENEVVRSWRDAFYRFKTKKGARCSIEALLKRVSKGGQIGCINPLVDIYNGISLKYGLPAGGENIDAFEGDIRLTLAEGGEAFITYGSDKGEPALPGEVIYKDDAGAICRCWNWRESVRTMLTEDVTNAILVLETSRGEFADRLDAALAELADKIQTELGGSAAIFIADKAHPEIELI